jgi:hypothetical protein
MIGSTLAELLFPPASQLSVVLQLFSALDFLYVRYHPTGLQLLVLPALVLISAAGSFGDVRP